MKQKVERIKTSLEIDEDIGLHITGWTVQRIGWILMLVFLVAAALGLFGDGILSKRELLKDGTTVVYHRFSRYESDTEIEIATESVNGEIVVKVPANFTDSYKIERIMPEPESRTINNRDTEFSFTARGPGKVTFFVSPRKKGSFEYVLSVNDTQFTLSNFIYP